MARKKGGLGKGLDALFEDNATEDNSGSIVIKISEIEPNRNQPRKIFDQTALSELAESISQHGILSPLLVRPMPTGEYQLVAGERRWRAARMAGISEVPVLIRELSDVEVTEIALIENLQRENLNPVEEALGYQQLIDEYGLTQDEVSKRVNKSRSAVTNMLRLLRLPEPVLKDLENGKLSTGHAKVLLSLENPEEMQEFAATTVKGSISVRDLEKLIKKTKEAEKPEKIEKEEVPNVLKGNSYYKEMELALTEVLGRKVTIQEKNEKGTISVQFFSKEDLTDIATRLSGEK